MTAANGRALEFDPTANERLIVTVGVGPAIVNLLEPHGRVVAMPVGIAVAATAWDRVDTIVVALERPDCPPSIGLASPARAAELMTIIVGLKHAGSLGVERVVLEGIGPIQPHSGALRPLSELYLSAAHPAPASLPPSLSAAATVLARSHRTSTVLRGGDR